MYKTIMTDAPLFGRWHCDFLTIGSPCLFTSATKIFVMQEERSRFVMLHACKAETAIEVVLAFLHTFSIFGIPETVYSDKAQNVGATGGRWSKNSGHRPQEKWKNGKLACHKPGLRRNSGTAEKFRKRFKKPQKGSLEPLKFTFCFLIPNFSKFPGHPAVCVWNSRFPFQS